MSGAGDDWIVVMCSDCHEVPIAARTKLGVASTWEKLLICDACKQKWIERQQANVQVPPGA